MPNPAAIIAAVLLTASLAIAVLTGGSGGPDAAQLREDAGASTIRTLTPGPGQSDNLATFARREGTARLGSPAAGAGIFNGRPPTSLRDATPSRSLTSREDGPDADAGPRTINRPDPEAIKRRQEDLLRRRAERDLERQRRTQELRDRSQNRLSDRALANGGAVVPGGPTGPAPNVSFDPLGDAPAPSDAADTPANTDPFADIIPDSLPPELRALIADLLLSGGIDPSDPTTFPSNNNNTSGNNNSGSTNTDTGRDPDADNGPTNTDGTADPVVPDTDTDPEPTSPANPDEPDEPDPDADPTEPAVAPAPLRLVWAPVDTATCTGISGLVTNDLYVEVDAAGRVTQILADAADTGIQIITGDAFDPRTGAEGAVPPSQAAVDANPCNTFDTFFTLNNAPLAFANEPPVAIDDDASPTITTAFSLADPDQLNDGLAELNPDAVPVDGRFVRIARITVTPGTSTVRGAVAVTTSSTDGTPGTPTTLDIPDEPSIWNPTTGDPDTPNDGSDPGSDPGTPGDDPTDPDAPGPGDGGGDPDDPDTGGGPGDPDPDEPEPPAGPTLVYVIEQLDAACNDPDPSDPNQIQLDNADVVSLFVRFDDPDEVIGVATGDIAGVDPITFAGGTPIQHPAGGNFPPPQDFIDFFPCLAFDSYLALGSLPADRIIAITPPPTDDWSDPIETVWFVLPPGAIAQQEPSTFGDDGYYVRLAQFNLPDGVVPAGTLSINFRPFGTNDLGNARLDLPPLPDLDPADP